MERIAGRRRRVGVLGWGSNPLRRRVDRIEAGILAGLLVAFLIGAPLLAVAAGWWEHGAAVAELRAQRSVHLVTAVLLQDVPDIGAGTGTWDAGPWPGGQHRTASPVSAWSWTRWGPRQAAGSRSGSMGQVGRRTRR